MRIARYRTASYTGVGVVVEDRVVDVASLRGAPKTLIDVLAGPPEAWRELNALAHAARGVAVTQVELLAPIRRPPKFLGIGMNSPDHGRELMQAERTPEVLEVLEASAHLRQAFPRPSFPTLFNKQTSCICGPYDAVLIPRDSTKVDYEGELALVIGRTVRNAELQEAEQAIGGYTVTNDVSVRDWQWNTSQMWLGKSYDTHGPTGPWIVTADEFDPAQAVIRTWVNDELRQEGAVADMTLSPAEIVAAASRVCTLEPGDLIACGTPAGIGAITGNYLAAGDTVRVAITGLGEITNTCVNEPAPVRIAA
ncbi:MAG: fumarylacetoacetate hydrolase family protein [Solirubrobacteraceae bacterium]